MKLRIGLPLLVLLASVSVMGQDPAPSGYPSDDSAYVSSYVPKLKAPVHDQRVKDEARGRREWMKERMGGELTAAFRDSMIAQANALQAQYPNAYNPGAAKPGAPGTWTNIGPARSNWIENFYRLTKSDTGRLRTILVHPSNPDIVYLLTSGGGLWKTTNYLSPRPAWAPKSDAILGTAGGGVAFGGNPNTLYLGSGDPFDGGVGGFVSKSTDGGETWSATVPVGISTTIQDIKVDSTTGSDIIFVATNAGLYRSTNGGASYHAISPIPANGSQIVWSMERSSAGLLVTFANSGFSNGGILLTADRGNTFVSAMTGITGGIGRTTLAVGAPGDAVVYAYAATTPGSGAQKDLYRSSDGGQSWTALGLPGKTPVNPNEEQPNMDIMLGQAFYNQMVLVDPSDANRNTVYIGGQLASAKTTDGGATWRLISNWLAQFDLPYVHADHHAAAYFPHTRSIMFGTDGGLFVSSDGGKTFSDSKNDGIASYLIYALATNEKHADDVIIGLQDNGTRLRVGTSNTYNQVFGGDGFGVGWGAGNTLASIYYSFMIRTPHGTPATEQKWFVGYNGLDPAEFLDADGNWPNTAATHFFTVIQQPSAAAAPAGRTFFHKTRRTLYRTDNSAASWRQVYRLPNTVSGEFRGVIHPIGTGFDNLQEIAVAMSASRVAVSLDGGQNFTIRSLAGVPGFGSFVTAVAWARPGEIYVSTENPNPAQAHLVKSTDGGATWTRIDQGNGLPPVPISKLLVSTRDATRRTIYAGTWLGVFESTDAGATWHLFGSGLPLVMVSDLYMPADGSFLRAATYGRGVFDLRF